ncbi:hypothetical protein LDENG_00215360 [Lucifuga dentata]|nr:hypothetical protein LDENG_00215360 [Lucifuga dentata]
MTRISVHSRYLSNQVTRFSRTGHPLMREGAQDSEGGVNNSWSIVVLVQDKNMDSGVAAERRRALVFCLHLNLKHLHFLIVKGVHAVDAAIVRVNVNIRGDRHVLHFRVQN